MSDPDSRPVCFVVMGFGKKTDFEQGITFDLDATYEAIIAPAMQIAGVRGIRADEIIHSGIIDVKMYEMLLRADLVIADISTGNVNAVYELGVRHALKPHATIVMKESSGRLYFDLDHTSTFHYEHLGKDIGHREAARACAELSNLITKAIEAKAPDSPVYTYLPQLLQPKLSDKQYEKVLDQLEVSQMQLAESIKIGKHSFAAGHFEVAAASYSKALTIKPGEPYLVQQCALATYKSQRPTILGALIEGLRIIENLNPDKSNDPETLGISGAIRKRLWLATQDISQLEAAIRYYRRGFEFTRDYYNGENLALCYAIRATQQRDDREKNYDAMSAKKICEELVRSLKEIVEAESFNDRSDRQWIYATLSICLMMIGNLEFALNFESKFKNMKPDDWQIQTFEANKELLKTAATLFT